MPIIFISTVRTLTNDAKAMFPGQSGIGVVELTIKARTNGLIFLSNTDESDGFRIAEGGSMDVVTQHEFDVYDLNKLYWKNTVKDSHCIVEIFGKRRV